MPRAAPISPTAIMRTVRLLLACVALCAVSPVPAAAAATPRRVRQRRAVVLMIDGRKLTVISPLLAVRDYTVAGAAPSGLAFGSQITMRARGAIVSAIRIHGRRHDVAYVAAVSRAAAGSITLRLPGGAHASYRPGPAAALELPGGRLRPGSEALVSVRARRRGVSVTVARAAGSPAPGDARDVGVITGVASRARRITVLTDRGLELTLDVPADLSALPSFGACRATVVYYRRERGGLSATMVALSDQAPVAGCAALRGGQGFVTAVAGDDRSLTVRPDGGPTLTLHAAGRTLRAVIDAVSVTDHVVFTYAVVGDQAEIATLRDTSASESGTVTALDRAAAALSVRVRGRATLDLHAARPALLDGIRAGDAVDVDYYATAAGRLVAVNLDDQGPARAGGNGGGSVSGGGSCGSAGSGGSAWAAGSPGSAGSAGSAGSCGSAGSAGAAGSAGSASAAGTTDVPGA